jgi:hypothetical protein
LGRKKVSPDARGPPVSETRRRKAQQRASWAGGERASQAAGENGLGPGGKRGRGERPRAKTEDGPRDSEDKRAAGKKGWASGPKMRRKKIFFFFFLFNYFKAFSNDFET